MTIPTIHFNDPAYSIVEKLGGKAAVAEKLGLDKSTISRWCQPVPQGTGGLVPQRYWPQLIEIGRAQKVRVTLKDLVALEV